MSLVHMNHLEENMIFKLLVKVLVLYSLTSQQKVMLAYILSPHDSFLP